MRLLARLEALERKIALGGELALIMPDGREHLIPLRSQGDGVLEYFAGAMRDPAGAEAALVRESVTVREPDASYLIELARAILAPNIDSLVTEVVR